MEEVPLSPFPVAAVVAPVVIVVVILIVVVVAIIVVAVCVVAGRKEKHGSYYIVSADLCTLWYSMWMCVVPVVCSMYMYGLHI